MLMTFYGLVVYKILIPLYNLFLNTQVSSLFIAPCKIKISIITDCAVGRRN